MRLLLTLFLLLFSVSAQAAELSMHDFAQIPVLHEGRIKPLDSFARIYLKKFADRESIDGLSADEWLAESLFDPAKATTRKIFYIHDKDIKRRMNLPLNQRYFSFTALQPGLQETSLQIDTLLEKDPKDITAQQNALLTLHENALLFAQIMRSFSLILPLNIELPEKYKKHLNNQTVTYLSLFPLERDVINDVKKIVRLKGQDIKNYTNKETALAKLSFDLEMFRMAGENNKLLRVIPEHWNADNKLWHTPWALILEGHGSPENKAYLDLWSELAQSYRNQKIESWNEASQKLLNKATSLAKPLKLEAEILYNTLKPFNLALILYIAGGAFILAAARYTTPLLNYAAISSVAFAIFFNAAGLANRIFIMDRAPVGTLYESTLFVAFVCAGIGLLLYRTPKNYAAILSGTVSAIGLLLIAPYLAPKGENMEMLVAVLNTNFWLATHVLCITAGYAGTILCACLAHGDLLMRAYAPAAKAIKKLHLTMYRSSLVALLLMSVGTALGGIWADQSWGRFWGWDPKENGALLICLWLIWAQHGRHSAKLKPLAFSASIAALNIIVALSWFGVNLLSVGLHSYGFIDGIAWGLSLFCAGELILIGGLVLIIKQKERTNT